jgi:hypothetical protein
MTSGELLKYRKGLRITGGYGCPALLKGLALALPATRLENRRLCQLSDRAPLSILVEFLHEFEVLRYVSPIRDGRLPSISSWSVQVKYHKEKLSAFVLSFLFASPSMLLAAGFDDDYSAHTGDLDSNGLIDIYLQRQTELVFVNVGGILTPIVTAQREVGEFYLQNLGSGQFDVAPLSNSQLATVRQWPEQDIAVVARHINFDSAADAQLVGVDEVIPGALDQMIFSDESNFAEPVSAVAMDEDLQQFIFDSFAWSVDVDYFRDSAPWKIVGVDPGTGQWRSAIFDSGNLFLINNALARCEIQTGNVCVVSSIDPSPCVRSVIIRDEVGNIVGADTVNVCVAGIHIYAYTPGSVLVEQDFSVFHHSALEIAEEIEDYSPGGIEEILEAEMDPEDWEALNGIIREILKEIFGEEPLDEVEEEDDDEFFADLCLAIGADEVNSFDHDPFPLDDSFPMSDPTFHHYDLQTKACEGVEPNCTIDILKDHVLPRFSYPSERLRPTDPTFDPNDLVLVYVAPPGLTRWPRFYELPFGYVVQRMLGEEDLGPENGPWQLGAIQNITTPAHFVHPGTISRTLTVGVGTKPHFFTHGIGLNRAGTTIKEIMDIDVPSQGINMLLGCANDVWGPEAFRALDKQAVKYWQENITSAPLGSSKPFLPPVDSAEYSAE